MNELEMLQEQRKLAWKRVKSSHTLLVRAHILCAQLERRYKDDEHEYKTIDHRLAMIDGRYQIILPTERRRKVRELTLEEIQAVAASLGISLDNEGITIEGEDNGLSDDKTDSPRLEGVEEGEDTA